MVSLALVILTACLFVWDNISMAFGNEREARIRSSLTDSTIKVSSSTNSLRAPISSVRSSSSVFKASAMQSSIVHRSNFPPASSSSLIGSNSSTDATDNETRGKGSSTSKDTDLNETFSSGIQATPVQSNISEGGSDAQGTTSMSTVRFASTQIRPCIDHPKMYVILKNGLIEKQIYIYEQCQFEISFDLRGILKIAFCLPDVQLARGVFVEVNHRAIPVDDHRDGCTRFLLWEKNFDSGEKDRIRLAFTYSEEGCGRQRTLNCNVKANTSGSERCNASLELLKVFENEIATPINSSCSFPLHSNCRNFFEVCLATLYNPFVMGAKIGRFPVHSFVIGCCMNIRIDATREILTDDNIVIWYKELSVCNRTGYITCKLEVIDGFCPKRHFIGVSATTATACFLGVHVFMFILPIIVTQ